MEGVIQRIIFSMCYSAVLQYDDLSSSQGYWAGFCVISHELETNFPQVEELS